MAYKINTDNDLFLFDITGFSMWPFLKTGEKVVIKKVLAGDLSVGDIILYHYNNQMICHRLARKVARGHGYLLYTCGDAGSNLGKPITEEALVGKVIGILRKGHIVDFTGRWRHFVNWFIVEFAPFLRIGIRIIKRCRNYI